METNLMPMLTDVGFPIGLCLILLYGFKKVGEVLLARVVDPVAPRTESSSRSLSNSLSFKGNWCERWFLFRKRFYGSWSRLPVRLCRRLLFRATRTTTTDEACTCLK